MKKTALVVIAGALVLAACSPKNAPTASKPVATVDGAPISRELFEYVTKALSGKASADLTADQRNQILDQLVQAEVALKQAEKQGLDKKGDVPMQLEMNRLQVLQSALLKDYLAAHKPTDAEVKAEYDTRIGQQAKTDFHAHHILVKTKEEADAIIAQLKKGAKFEALAGEKSIDTGSKLKGGDLNWFSPSDMVKPFADATALLAKGAITQEPVQTQFGWHVIRLDETRPHTPPAFEQVKDQVTQSVENGKLKAYLEELSKAAKVEKSL